MRLRYLLNVWKSPSQEPHQRRVATLRLLLLMLFIFADVRLAGAQTPAVNKDGIFETTFASTKAYSDPFNDVEVDVVFIRGQESWRVPTFWRGEGKWTVRFAPPTPGEYTYHLESTDRSNPDLNGHEAKITIAAYQGPNSLLQHGMLRVSANKRYFEHADGTPFYWLGDTWWTGLSDRLSWDGFQKLTADRKAKGFTVVQIVAGLIPSDEEVAPVDPGFRNEGGAVWDPEFRQINPKYFDYADRRIQHLIDAGIVPAIFGSWVQALNQMGVAKMKKHWRYIIARYGAYPVLYVVGGEIYDPPADSPHKPSDLFFGKNIPGGWSEVARYIRATDPVHHPLTVHEAPPYDPPLQEESLTDFDMFQPSHMGFPSLALEVEEVDATRMRTSVTKPEVVGEIGYETLGGTHLEDFQRMAFWLGMLNGAAGYTYGANAVWESYTADKPFHRWKWSFVTWDEGMNLPGSYQVGLGSKLLRQYEWWRLEPRPDWITPRGTTFLEPRVDLKNFDWGMDEEDSLFSNDEFAQPMDGVLPGGEWKARHGNFRLPYAAGIPGELRIVYMPCFGLNCATPATVLGLEPAVRYHAYYWEPSLGIKVDLGAVERPSPGAILRQDKFESRDAAAWKDYGAKTVQADGKLSAPENTLTLLSEFNEANYVASVAAKSVADAGLVLRFHDPANYLAAFYSAKEKQIYLLDRAKGVDGRALRTTAISSIGGDIRLTAEVRGKWATVSITDGQHTYSAGIVRVNNTSAGSAGLLRRNDGRSQTFSEFELRQSPTLVADDHLERKLYDARGGYRGTMTGPALANLQAGWSEYGKEKIILLDEYRPDKLPGAGDWVLVLEKNK